MAEGRSSVVLVAMALSGVGIGALTAVQARANGSLSTALGSGLQAATVSFAVGLGLLSLIGLSLGRVRRGLLGLVATLRTGTQPVWIVLGGLAGALFITTQSFSVPVIGVALFSVALVAGQISSSLLVDSRGWGPRGRQPVSLTRVGAAVLGLAAVAVASGGRWNEGPEAIAWVVLCVATGAAVSWQQAANGRVGALTGEPLVAAWINFMLAAAVVAVIWMVTVLAGLSEVSSLPSEPAWLYVGGAVGALFIAAAAWIVGGIGVLAVTLLVTAGQLVGAIALDLVVFGSVPGALIVGAALAFVAVAVGGLGDRRAAVRSRSRA